MPVLVPRHEPLLLCASKYKNPSSPVQFKMTNSLTNLQQAKPPAVAIETKAFLEIAKRGSGPGVSYGAMSAPQTVGTMGNALSIFDPTHSPGQVTGSVLIVVLLGFIFTEPVGLFEEPEKRMVDALAIMLVAVLLYLLLRTLFSIDTMMATVKLIFRTVAFVACITLCPSVYHDPAKAVVGVVFVDEIEHSARKRKVGGHCSAVRRRRCCPGPSALVFLALALLCGIDGGWAAFTPNVREFAKAQKVSLASFENEKNGTVLDVPIPIIRPPLDEIDPTSIVCQRLCQEGQNQGTF